MDWVKNWIVTKFVKGLLDKLPANNKKTYLGIIITVLSIVVQLWPENPVSPIIASIINMLSSMGAEDMSNIGIGVTAIGVVHKVLKWLRSKE